MTKGEITAVQKIPESETQSESDYRITGLQE
jgi:hypothetical protein